MRDAFTLRKMVSVSSLGKNERWYARFFDPETGKESTQKSVEKLAKELKIPPSNKLLKEREAQRICALALDAGLIFKKKCTIPFVNYVKEYWDFDGDRIRRKNRRNPGSINKDYAIIMNSYFVNHVEKKLPKGLLLEKVTVRHINSVIDALIDDGKLANATIQKIQLSMTSPLREAYRQGLIDRDPTLKLEGIQTNSKRIRGIITTSELQAILKRLQVMKKDHAYLAVALSAATGMRLGEIRALHVDSIEVVNEMDTIVTVSESFAKKAGFKGTKGKKTRYVPLDRRIAEALIDFSKKNLINNCLVFWSYSSSIHPISASYISEAFNEAVAYVFEEAGNCKGESVTLKSGDEIRKGEAMRRERNIVFHSLRHFYVSGLRGIVSETKLRLASGHQSEAMSDVYTHVTYENLKEVAEASRNLVMLPEKQELLEPDR